MQTCRTTFLAAGLLLTCAHPASGQSARQVLESAAERYEQRMQGIENYTLVQDVWAWSEFLHVLAGARPAGVRHHEGNARTRRRHRRQTAVAERLA
jgi:hypothetical protein